MTRKEAIALWKEKVHDRAPSIDENYEHEWETLALGFFLALLPIADAREAVSECYLEDLL